MSLQNAKSEGLHLLELLNILHKKNELVGKLSGGMKRKLSLAIALTGNHEVKNYYILYINFKVLTTNRYISMCNNVDDLTIDTYLR